MSSLSLVKFWLWASALATAAGWILSAVGQLNRTGYTIVCGIVVVFLSLRCRTLWRDLRDTAAHWKRVGHRFRRSLPCCFAVLALLAFLGGVIYPPTNHTALTYRIPRVMHWLAHEHWYWIHTANYRMNDRSCGIEWMTAPLILFTKSDRGLFLLNFFPFLLLPGLIFSVCTRLGVRGRVAWQWMWLLPTGYNFLLQAASAGNDTFPTVYALAAIHFGCRAWTSRRPSDLWYSLLAAALMTGAKPSNLPLLLPWAILIVALLPVLRRRPAATMFVVLTAALVSFLPNAVLNVIYCGDWSGLKLEHTGMDMKNPLVGIWGNALLLLVNNFVPPFFPQAGWWNQSALSILPQALVAPLVANFEQGFHILGEMPTEDWAGIGFGVSTLLAVSVVASWFMGSPAKVGLSGVQAIPAATRRCALVASWIALLAYCGKSGMVTAARLISPYYPLLLPLLLIGAGQAEVIRRRWWRAMTWGVLVLALMVEVLTPARPLWPAQSVLAKALSLHPGQPKLRRATEVYSVYAHRYDSLADVRALLPNDLKVVGFLGTPDDMDISLWRPYFSRRVEHILLSDTPAQIRERGIQYVVVSGLHLKENQTTLAAWLQQTGAEWIATTNAIVKVTDGPQPWHLVRFNE